MKTNPTLPNKNAELEITSLQRLAPRDRGDAGIPPVLNPGQRKIIGAMQANDRKSRR